jgi:hypothetical protein
MHRPAEATHRDSPCVLCASASLEHSPLAATTCSRGEVSRAGESQPPIAASENPSTASEMDPLGPVVCSFFSFFGDGSGCRDAAEIAVLEPVAVTFEDDQRNAVDGVVGSGSGSGPVCGS